MQKHSVNPFHLFGIDCVDHMSNLDDPSRFHPHISSLILGYFLDKSPDLYILVLLHILVEGISASLMGSLRNLTFKTYFRVALALGLRASDSNTYMVFLAA